MPLNHRNTRFHHRTAFAGITETITVLKRGDDQAEGTVNTLTFFRCRRGLITKTGEPLAGDMNVDHRTIWHIPRQEMDRNGVQYFNPDDRFIDVQGRVWQPEGDTTMITDKLFENEMDVQCVRIK